MKPNKKVTLKLYLVLDEGEGGGESFEFMMEPDDERCLREALRTLPLDPDTDVTVAS